MRTIAHISDLHFGSDEPLVTRDLVASVSQANPDLVVLSGDFTQRATRDQFERARQFVEQLPQPRLVVPGNHDMPLFNIFARLFWPYSNYEKFIRPLGVANARFVDDEIALIGLNTARRFTGKNGRVSKEQVEAVRAFFADIPDDVFQIVVTHHPLGQADNEVFLELAFRAELAVNALVTSKVHILLSGHHHRALGGKIEETDDRHQALIVYAGTANSTRLREGDGNTYNLLRLDWPNAEIMVMRWVPGTGFVPGRQSQYVYANERWSPVGARPE